MADTKFRRSRKDRDFTSMSNIFLKDVSLSMAAKGLFAYILSLPDDWEIYMSELESHFTTTTYEMRKVVKELEEHGYVVRNKTKDDHGKFSGWYFEVNETPVITEMRNTDIGETESPKNRKSVNRTLLNTNNKQITNNTNNLINSSETNVSSEFAEAEQTEEKNDEATMWNSLSDNPSPNTSSHNTKKTHKSNTTSESTDNTKECAGSVSARDIVAHYTDRWNIMKEHGYVHTECPPQSFPQIGKLIKSSGADLEQLKKVIDAGFKSSEDIIKNNGYALKTMLSSWWVNKVLNGSTSEIKKNYRKQPASPYKLDKNAEYSKGDW